MNATSSPGNDLRELRRSIENGERKRALGLLDSLEKQIHGPSKIAVKRDGDSSKIFSAMVMRLVGYVLDHHNQYRFLQAFIDETDSFLASSDAVLFTLERKLEKENGRIIYSTKDWRANPQVEKRKLESFRRNFTQHLGKLAKSPFLKDLFDGYFDREVFFSAYCSNYEEEFDPIAKFMTSSQWKPANGLWFVALELEENSRLIAVEPNKGNLDRLVISSPFRSLESLFEIFHSLYALTEKSLERVANEVQKNKSAIIANVAPGVLHHEIRPPLSLLGSAVESLDQSYEDLKKTGNEVEFINRLLDNLKTIHESQTRIESISKAFNDLERKQREEPIGIDEVMRKTMNIVAYRLQQGAIVVNYPEDRKIELVTDGSLLVVVFTNIMLNAVYFLNEAQRVGKIQRKKIKIDWSLTSDDTVRIDLINNGTPMNREVEERLFERGFTQRPQGAERGHGQGLYICKVVGMYLGGYVALIPREKLPSGFNVGFRLTLPRKVDLREDLEKNIKTQT